MFHKKCYQDILSTQKMNEYLSTNIDKLYEYDKFISIKRRNKNKQEDSLDE
jgi:hypothetical protein